MSTDTSSIGIERQPAEQVQSTIGSIKKMVVLSAVFAAVGYILVIGALVLEFTQFHPLIENFFRTYTETSLAGGGPERTAAGINTQLASIHKFPSTLLWMKLGGIAHVLVGIFISLVAIIRVLSLMPHRLSYEMERTQG
ncbi:MAG: hypothetical protein ABEH64_09400 [Salinirussus sp.]